MLRFANMKGTKSKELTFSTHDSLDMIQTYQNTFWVDSNYICCVFPPKTAACATVLGWKTHVERSETIENDPERKKFFHGNLFRKILIKFLTICLLKREDLTL